MAIRLPSDNDLKTFGQILFYALIIPALCYYTWQVLKAIFISITPSNDNNDKTPEDNDPNSIFVAIKYTNENNIGTEKVICSSEFAPSPINLHQEIKNNAVEQLNSSDPIKEVIFFKKDPIFKSKPSDPEPTPQNRQNYIHVQYGSQYHHYFRIIEKTKSIANDTISLQDSPYDFGKKIKNKITGGILRYLHNKKTLDNWDNTDESIEQFFKSYDFDYTKDTITVKPITYAHTPYNQIPVATFSYDT
jgi:hypothetical protein